MSLNELFTDSLRHVFHIKDIHTPFLDEEIARVFCFLTKHDAKSIYYGIVVTIFYFWGAGNRSLDYNFGLKWWIFFISASDKTH